MPERSSKSRTLRGSDQLAKRIGQADMENAPQVGELSPPEKNPHAAALGQLGGKKGGPARAVKLSAERRSEIAQKAAQARWRRAHEDTGSGKGGSG